MVHLLRSFHRKPGVVSHTCNPIPWHPEGRWSARVLRQPALKPARPYLKNKNSKRAFHRGTVRQEKKGSHCACREASRWPERGAVLQPPWGLWSLFGVIVTWSLCRVCCLPLGIKFISASVKNVLPNVVDTGSLCAIVWIIKEITEAFCYVCYVAEFRSHTVICSSWFFP